MQEDMFAVTSSQPRAVDVAEKINIIHAEMTGHMTMAVKKAIEVGRLLTEQKEQIAHGEWIPWIESNLMFGRSQAANYMRAYRERDRLNVQSTAHLNEAVALLAQPKEEPETVADVDTAEPVQPEIVFRDNPDQEKRVNAAEFAAKEAQRRLRDASTDIERKEKELVELRKLKADKDRVERTLADLHELEKKKQELFADAESTKLVQSVLVRSREFFTRECMQIPALKLRPESIKVMRQDFEGLIELVDNWSTAMKERFL